MSTFADQMTKRNQRERKSALDAIANVQGEPAPVEPVVQQPDPQPVPQIDAKQFAYRPKLKKREKQSDTCTSRAYMIENELLAIIDDIVGDEWGGKNRFINEAIKLAIYQEFPEYAHRIKPTE